MTTQSGAVVGSHDADLAGFLAPRSVAVVGASDDPRRIGGRVFAHLREDLGDGAVPVNPRRATVQGVPAAASIVDLDTVPELAVITVPADQAVDAVVACGARGVSRAVVFSGGFAEVDSGGEGPGATRQRELVEAARAGGVRLMGPNCLGVLNLADGVRPTFMNLAGLELASGPLAIVSQSGALGIQLFEQAQAEGLGIGFLCTTGNEADVGALDLVDHLLGRDDVATVLMLLEGVPSLARLVATGRRALDAGKPLVALKLGRTPLGAAASLRHTASQPQDQALLDAAMDSVGILRAAHPRRLLELGKVLAAGRLPAARRVAVVTGSGGAGIVMADAAADAGMELPGPGPALRPRLLETVPWFGSVENPIDHTAQIVNDMSQFSSLVTSTLAAEEYDATVLAGPGRSYVHSLAGHLRPGMAANDKPVIVWTFYPDAAAALMKAGIPASPEPTEPMAVLAQLHDLVELRRFLAQEEAEQDPVLERGAEPLDPVDRSAVAAAVSGWGVDPGAMEAGTLMSLRLQKVRDGELLATLVARPDAGAPELRASPVLVSCGSTAAARLAFSRLASVDEQLAQELAALAGAVAGSLGVSPALTAVELAELRPGPRRLSVGEVVVTHTDGRALSHRFGTQEE